VDVDTINPALRQQPAGPADQRRLRVKRPYETVVIFDGTLPDETVKKEREALEKLIRENGEFDRTEEWGKRSLAYPINKKRLGVYFLLVYQAEGTLPAKIDKHYKLNTNVLRYLTVIRELKNIIPAAREFDQAILDDDGEGGNGKEGDE
jgi:small subunit ribosomal protein S6